VSYHGLYIDTCPFIICVLLKNSYLYLFHFFICSSYFLFYNFYFFGFPAPFSKKNEKSLSFFQFRLCIVNVGKKVQFKFLYRKNPKNNYGKIIIIKNYGKSFTYSYLGGTKYFKSPKVVCTYVYMYNCLDNTRNICIVLYT
jgi:hypothetical protein